MGHHGIRKKVFGQLSTFKKYGDAHLIHLRSGWDYFTFHFRAFKAVQASDVIYVRYNPKVPFLNAYLAYKSAKKPIVMEHNAVYETELDYIKRPFEKWCHLLSERLLYRSNLRHVVVSEQIRVELLDKGADSDRVILIQNGYQITPIDPTEVDHNVVNQVRDLRSRCEHVFIFIGNHYPWHGLDMIVDELRQVPGVGLLLVGPSDKLPHDLPDFCMSLGRCSPETIAEVLPYCDFGFGAYRWELVGITHGGPLKTREYLCYGVPIIVNYHDAALDIESLRPYVFDRRSNAHIIEYALLHKANSEQLKRIARHELSWDQRLQPVLACLGGPPKS